MPGYLVTSGVFRTSCPACMSCMVCFYCVPCIACGADATQTISMIDTTITNSLFGIFQLCTLHPGF